MDALLQDIRFALRRLARRPLFTAVAVLSLAIGIGANAGIFSLVNAVLIRDLPLERPEELVDVYKGTNDFSHGSLAYPDYRDLVRETGDVFTGVAATEISLVQTDVAGGVETLPTELVSGNYFQVLGVGSEAGRILAPEDDVSPGGHPVVVLSHAYWQRRYGGDPAAIGSSIRLNGRPYTIVGVVDRAYPGTLRGLGPEIYAPMAMLNHLNPVDGDHFEARGIQSIFAKARLRPGVGLERARGVTERVASSLRAENPEYWGGGSRFTLVPSDEVVVNPMIDRVLRPAAALIMGVVGLVLLIACTNLASFLLAQGADRRKEIAVRLALGARRGRLVRQLLTESVVLAGLGGSVGAALGLWGIAALVRSNAAMPFPVPLTLDVRPDGSVFAFALGATLAAAVLFGLLPALQSTNPDVAPTLKDESTGGGRPRGLRLRNVLVVGQVAISLVLLVGAGLFLRSLHARARVDPGFGDAPAALVTVVPAPERYSEEEARIFFRTLLDEAEALPGVEAAGVTANLHMNLGSTRMMSVYSDRVEPPPGQDYHLVDYSMVSPGFFEAAGVPLLRGRSFHETPPEPGDGFRDAVVNQVFAERFFDDPAPLGRTFRRDERAYRVVGVAGNTKVRSLGEEPRPFVYTPFVQEFTVGMTVVARTRGDASGLALDLVELARGMDPEIMIVETKTMERHLSVALLPHRLSAVAVGGFGAVALLLTVIGLYGVVRYAVAARSREMGIRMSLGADPDRIVRTLTAHGLKLVAAGTVLGLVSALVLARFVGSLLYGVEPTDPLVFAAGPVLLVAVVGTAAWLPARRASRIDPVKALKAE